MKSDGGIVIRRVDAEPRQRRQRQALRQVPLQQAAAREFQAVDITGDDTGQWFARPRGMTRPLLPMGIAAQDEAETGQDVRVVCLVRRGHKPWPEQRVRWRRRIGFPWGAREESLAGQLA